MCAETEKYRVKPQTA